MRCEIAVSGSILYACPVNASYQVPTIYKSTNGGANWAATTGQPTAGWTNGQGWYDVEVSIDPSNADNCIVGGLDTYKTINGGTSWTKMSEWVGLAGQYIHADIHKIVWFDGGNKLVIASDGGIFYSSDKGTTIRDRNLGLRIKQFYSCAIHPTTTNYFLAGAQDNGTHQFNNAGLSNSIEVKGGDGAFVAIDQNEPQFQFGSYVFNDYRRSTNSGATWSNVTLNGGSGQFINPFDYDNSANIMYCGDNAGAFRRWTDPQTGSASAVVSITSIVGSVTAVSVSPYTANRVFLGTSSGRVVRVDGANTIATGSAGTSLSTGLPGGTVSCINFGTTENNLISCQSNYGIQNVWVSTNGGTSWTAIDGNLPDMPVRWCMFYPGDNTKAIIATETGVWQTALINGASTVWVAESGFPTVRTDMLKYRALDGTIAAATHGRGLWTALIPLVTTPDIQFQNASPSSTEATASTSGCRGYTDYSFNMVILNPPTGAATVTLAVSGGTALQNVDYVVTTNGNFAVPSMVLTFPNAVTTPQPFTVRIYDDAAVESTETFTLSYTISGATNAQAGSSNQTFTYSINSNDAAPIGSGSVSGGVGAYNINLNQPFRSTQFDARTQVLYTVAELNALGFSSGNITSIGFNVITKGSTQPFNGFTIKLKNTLTSALASGAFETGATTVYTGNYSTVAGINTIPITSFLWDGTSNLLVDMCFDNTTASADDLIQGATSGANTYFDRQSTNVTPGCSIASSAFTFTTSSRPIITFGINISGTAVSTALNSTKNVYLGPNDDVYFYDAAGAILARIKNLTSFDYGCTQVTIDRAGSSSAQFWNSTPANYLFSKTCKVVPTNNTNAGNYEITLYYTPAEVAGWEAATGLTWTGSTIQVVKVSNGFFVPDVTPVVPHVADVSIVNGAKGTLGPNRTILGTYSSTGFSGFGVGVPGSAVSNITVNLKLFLQGYYIGGSTMQPVLNNQTVPSSTPTQADTVTVELHHPTNFALIDSKKAVLSTAGLVSATFTQPAGSYHIAIIHRNTIQTWTKNPIACSNATPLYNFSSFSTQAYGDNLVQVDPGVWAMFTGDLNQDEFIDGNDFPAYDTDSNNGVNSVYVATDMNGDGFVDGNDFPVFDSNSLNGVSAIHP
jgi:hypothetical protein